METKSKMYHFDANYFVCSEWHRQILYSDIFYVERKESNDNTFKIKFYLRKEKNPAIKLPREIIIEAEEDDYDKINEIFIKNATNSHSYDRLQNTFETIKTHILVTIVLAISIGVFIVLKFLEGGPVVTLAIFIPFILLSSFMTVKELLLIEAAVFFIGISSIIHAISKKEID